MLCGADANSSLVTRACEACRRRKTKCDAATTNTWPCSACIRLKLHCVPPSTNYNDRDFASNPRAYKPPQGVKYESGGSSGDESHQQQIVDLHKNISPYPNPGGVFYPGPPCPSHMDCDVQTADGFINQHQHEQDVLPLPPQQQQHSSHPDSPEIYEQDQYGQQNLADLLGELLINEAGTGRHPEHVSEHLDLTVYSSLSELHKQSKKFSRRTSV
jgi:hypothetical protein